MIRQYAISPTFADMLRSVNIIRYITPLREGGSLPAIAEADDEFLYVLKFRGAGQGPKALIAELLGCEIARALGMRVPELVYANLEEGFGRLERDEEIQDLLKFSVGLNLGVHYLSGAISYDPTVMKIGDAGASLIVWMDSLLMNVDRTAKNTNMLMWHKELWMIDHGASLYFHHGPTDWKEQAVRPFALIKDHVLLLQANDLVSADNKAKSMLTKEKIEEIVSMIPNEWLGEGISFDEQRARYAEYFLIRLDNSQIIIKAAEDARSARL